MEVDKKYCMSSYLMYRTICDSNKTFAEGIMPNLYNHPTPKYNIHTSDDLYNALKEQVELVCASGKTALALSGGIDSAILAKFMPKGSVAYTFKCVVPGVQVTDETEAAAKYAKECGLEHRIVEIYWEDCEQYAPILMKHKGAPLHSIEVQIYKAGLQAKKDGFDNIIYGESADCHYGGQSNLFSKDWTFGEFVDRYSYTKPYYVLRDWQLIIEPYQNYTQYGFVDCFNFMRNVFFKESIGSYLNACETAEINLCAPYANTWLDEPIDYQLIRGG